MDRCEHIPSDEKAYLAPMRRTTLTMEQRRYCRECGLVQEKGGRGPGFFVHWLVQLNSELERRPYLGIHPLTRAEMRLMVKAMEAQPLFYDPYGSTFEFQSMAFSDLVKRYRKVPEDTLQDAMPRRHERTW